MTNRKGAGRGTGKGYKNLRSFPRDASIHSQSAKGRKQPQKIPRLPKQNKFRQVYKSDKLIKYFDGKTDIEIYPRWIDGKRVWFVAEVSDPAIKDKEFSNKKEALAFVEKQYSINPSSDKLIRKNMLKIDKDILKELSNDSRQLLTDLSRKIKKPISDVFYRLKEIEKDYVFVAIKKDNRKIPDKLQKTAEFLEENSRATLTEIAKKTRKSVTLIYDEVNMLKDYYKFGVEKR